MGKRFDFECSISAKATKGRNRRGESVSIVASEENKWVKFKGKAASGLLARVTNGYES